MMHKHCTTDHACPQACPQTCPESHSYRDALEIRWRDNIGHYHFLEVVQIGTTLRLKSDKHTLLLTERDVFVKDVEDALAASPTTMPVGVALRHLRLRAGKKLDDMPVTHGYNLEKGMSNPTWKTIERWLRCCGATPRDLAELLG